jgi:hypothetical protein
MRVRISAQQQQLEKYQARIPHRRRPAKPRQQLLAHDQLHLEQQKSAKEDRKRE